MMPLMDPLRSKEFTDILSGAASTGSPAGDYVIRNVTTHSRRIRSGSAFFALRGDQADGHEFVYDALNNGAAAAVVRAGSINVATVATGRLIEVDEPLHALQRLAAWWRTQICGRVVAVVGSNGKTITKDAIVHLLGEELSVFGSPGSYNSQLGVPLALLDCPSDCDVAVFELAVSERGEMARLERIVQPDCVVMTNLGSRWRSQFRSRGEHARELLGITANVDDDGWLLLGRADEEIHEAADSVTTCRRFTLGESSLLPRFSKPRYEPRGLIVDVSCPDGHHEPLCVSTPSVEILEDVQLAISAATLLGLRAPRILDAAQNYRPTSTRMEIWRAPGGFTLIRDVATLDPIAVSSAIRAAKRVAGAGGRTLVVLKESLNAYDAPAVEALAHALVDEGASAVYGIDGALQRMLAQTIDGLDHAPPVYLFPTNFALRLGLMDDIGPGDVALVQSAPSAPIGDLSAAIVESMAATRLYLDMSAILDNVSTFRRIVGPSVRVMCVVKALAYGTEAVNVAACLEAAGVDFLGVANADEGIELRRAGVTLPILVMLGISSEVSKMLSYRLTPLVYSHDMLEAVLSHDPLPRSTFGVHVEVDTGMHRTGFRGDHAEEVLRRLRTARHVRVEGLMTHFACADDENQDEFTRKQIARFAEIVALSERLGFRDVIRHAAATAAMVRFPEAHFDMV
ncbi:MAG: alanine racemase, partial [Actinomycetota bacterium]|nr:alanine racemase [Actinomycetota bacterium]